MIYRFIRSLANIALKVFFRRTTIEGFEESVEDGPTIFISNHSNALVDGVIVACMLNRPVTLIVKSTLGDNPLLKMLFGAVGVVPFSRRQDAGGDADPARNAGSISECCRILAQGGAICLFPEGQSHSDPQLRRFHTGAARIVFEYLNGEGHRPPLKIVPVGLLYEGKDKFRSSVIVRLGDAIEAQSWISANPLGDVKDLTAEFDRRIRPITLNFEFRQESKILAWAAEIFATDAARPAALHVVTDPYPTHVQFVERLQNAISGSSTSEGSDLAELGRRIHEYRTQLMNLGISPDEVYLSLNPARAAFFALREFDQIVIGMPMAGWGIINHLVPYQITKFTGRKFAEEDDQYASNVVFFGLAIFPLFYAIQIFAAFALVPPIWAGLYALMLPYSGVFALLYRDRAGSVNRRTRTFMKFLIDRGLQEGLIEEGKGIIEELNRLTDAPADS